MCSTPPEKEYPALVADGGEQPRLPWQSRLVRDLAWSIGSPPLVHLDDQGGVWPDAGWFRQQLTGFATQLDSLDTDERARAMAFAAGRDQRLGSYFEALLALWLQRDPRFELLARNLAVRRPLRGGGRETLGELDLLVMNHLTGQPEHWEVAVKFYLGRLPGTAEAGVQWVGPGLKDRLDIKLARLLDHQLGLPTHARTQAILDERGLGIEASRVIFKGRLFYPLDAPLAPPAAAGSAHLRGWWLRAGDFPGPFAGRDWSWRRLTRREWLAPVEDRSAPNRPGRHARSFAQSEDIAAATWPRMVVALSAGREITRGFLVPDGWDARAGSHGDKERAPDPGRTPVEAES